MMLHADRAHAGRVVIGLSGGVDSAVAAALLCDLGFEVHALAIDTWRPPQQGADRTTSTDVPHAATAVADALGIPLTQVDLRDTFYQQVVQPFAASYAAGLTPNPCVFCNPNLKFAALLHTADALGARWIATGHYARATRDAGGSDMHPNTSPGRARLLRARAADKDQSYALYRLTQRELQRLVLPLGEVVSKEKVREIARNRGLPSADATDSQDLCFVAGGDYRALLAYLHTDGSEAMLQPGPIFDSAGTQIGQHRGLHHYTVGQRGGLGLAASERLYVLRLEPQRNAIVVGPRHELARTACDIEDTTFTSGAPPALEFDAHVRIRYRAPLVSAHVVIQDIQNARVTFGEPQYGVAPGQSLVMYDGEEVWGGGIIART